jgi:hypothetical protein
MITDRFMEESDLALLELSLSRDEHHEGTTPEFFTEPGTLSKVYEDERGPILFVKGTPVLRLDIQYVSNEDFERNKEAMLEGFPPLAAKAKANGYKEIIFESNVRALRIFCQRHFGFKESAGELRKIL